MYMYMTKLSTHNTKLFSNAYVSLPSPQLLQFTQKNVYLKPILDI